MTAPGTRHLVLIGLMGAGKTTIGRACAARLGRPFVDTDDLVEASTGQTVRELFNTIGEAAFRELERDAVANACNSPEPLVIACGGGALLDPTNRRRLTEHGLVVWLRASPATLAARVQHETGTRPLLESRDALIELDRLTALRDPAYEAAAHAVVETEGLGVEEAVAAVLDQAARCSV